MNNRNRLTQQQALHKALSDAGIANTESRCLLNRYCDGLYQMLVRTPYLKYEFYVDAETGEVLGMNSEPLPYPEMLSLCTREEEDSPAAA